MSDLDYSVILPTFNRPDGFVRCLEGIANLEAESARVEVIVINDGGTIPAADICKTVAARFAFTLLSQANAGPAAARNLGAARARGHWLAFLDDDCVPACDWLIELAKVLQENIVVGGSVANGFEENVYAEASSQLYEFLYDYYHVRAMRTRQLPFFTSNNFALARSAFRAVGGFNPTMRHAEDRELCTRLLTSGYQLVYAPKARITHLRKLNPRGFVRQHYEYGMGAFDYHQILRAYGNRRLTPEPPTFYFELLTYPWKNWRGARAVYLSFLLAISQGANLSGFLNSWRKQRRAQPNPRVESTRVTDEQIQVFDSE
jgi:GT2 family glycosyltransferase